MPIPVGQVDAHESVQHGFADLAVFLRDLFGGTEPRIRWGTTTITWPGGTPDVSGLTFSHGLNRNPASVLLTSLGARVVVLSSTSTTSTTVTYAAHNAPGTSPPLNATDTVCWLAVG